MRITVGGVLVVVAAAGAGGYFAYGPLQSLSNEFLFSKPRVEKTAPPKPAAPRVATSTASTNLAADFSQPRVSTQTQAAVAVLPPAPVTSEAPAAPAAAAEEKPLKHSRRRRRRKKASAGAVAAATPKIKSRRKRKSSAAAPQAAAAAAPDDKLKGTLVVLKLKTGRDVTGVYLSKSDTQYKIELPALGEFEYPIANVDSIAPAK